MTATARIIQLSPPARTQRATKPKATPSPYVSFSPEFLSAMASLAFEHSRAQRAVTGGFAPTPIAADIKRQLTDVIARAQAAKRACP